MKHLACIVAVGIGCSSGGEAAVAPAAEVGNDALDGDSYPAGPYGTAPGSVLEDLAVEGYMSFATTGLAKDATPLGTFRLADLRAKTTAKYMFIHTAGYWCSTCVTAAKEIVAAYPELASKAVFVELLTEGKSPDVPASRANLDLWITTTEIPFSTAKDVEGPPLLRPRLGVEDMSYVVEVRTMRIINRTVDYRKLLAELRAL